MLSGFVYCKTLGLQQGVTLISPKQEASFLMPGQGRPALRKDLNTPL